MWKFVLGALAAFLLILVWRAPAGLMRYLVERVPDARLAATEGTIWQGAGQLIVAAGAPHRLSWSLEPWSLARLQAEGDYRLEGPDVDLNGHVTWTRSQGRISIAGSARPTAVAPLLDAHGLGLDGAVAIGPLEIEVTQARIERIEGVAHWPGGTVRHAFDGEPDTAVLGPVTATIATGARGPLAVVKNDADAMPLLEVELRHDGFVRVGVTKALTKMLNRPWPGAGPDAGVVFQVEEKIYGFQ